jgi:hypothetical protein
MVVQFPHESIWGIRGTVYMVYRGLTSFYKIKVLLYNMEHINNKL